MNLDQQVTSLETSKKLKELGLPQTSLFGWFSYSLLKEVPHLVGDRHSQITYKGQSWSLDMESNSHAETQFWLSAFTASELGEMLSKNNKSGFDFEYLHTAWNGILKTWTAYAADSNPEYDHSIDAKTEVEARGLMLIYLLENNIIKL